MKITAVDVIPYRIPNREVHKIATLTLSAIENVIVRIRTDKGVEGIGECVTEAKWNSTVMEAHAVLLEKYLVPAIIGADPFRIREVWARMDEVVNGQLPSKGAIDIALHDLIGKAVGVPVWRLLGGSNARPVLVEGPGYGIGFMKPEAAVELALKGISDGCRQIEVKCGHPSGPEHDLAVIDAVHRACGPDVSLKIDCTEGYTFKDALKYLPVRGAQCRVGRAAAASSRNARNEPAAPAGAEQDRTRGKHRLAGRHPARRRDGRCRWHTREARHARWHEQVHADRGGLRSGRTRSSPRLLHRFRH